MSQSSSSSQSFNPSSLELDIPIEPSHQKFKPKSISLDHMPLIFAGVPASVRLIARALINDGWKIYAVKQTRGACYHHGKVITIPVWVIERNDIGKKIWYICHEMAHALAPKDEIHGPIFMAQLIEICPKEYIHHELGYKPRNAAKAGITLFLDL